VDDTVLALVAPALMARRHPPVGIPAGSLGQGPGERLFRRLPGHLPEVGHARPAAAGRARTVLANSHLRPLRLEDLDRLAGGKGHGGPLDVRALAEAEARPLHLALAVH